MQKLCAVFLLTLAVSACDTEPTGPLFGDRDLEEAPELAPSKEGLRDSTPSCELKGPVNARKCMDGRGETGNNPGMQSNLRETPNARATNFNPADCQRNGINAVGMVNMLLLSGQLKAFQDFCIALENQQAREATSGSAVPVQSTPANSTGGGCEWKGRNYAPGDSIYHTEGPIYSSDLFINGQNFGNLSGKPGPWQMCECQVSVGHWGCV